MPPDDLRPFGPKSEKLRQALDEAQKEQQRVSRLNNTNSTPEMRDAAGRAADQQSIAALKATARLEPDFEPGLVQRGIQQYEESLANRDEPYVPRWEKENPPWLR